jgi:hypothetical protein
VTPEERRAALMPLGRVLLASLERHAKAKAAKAAEAQPPPPRPLTDDDLRKRPRYRPFQRPSSGGAPSGGSASPGGGPAE